MKMKQTLLISAVLLATAAIAPAKAQVTVLDDPLHGQCSAGCSEATIGGTKVTPIFSNAPVNWGFSISPVGASGTLFLDFLIPDNTVLPGSIGITGFATTTANLISPQGAGVAWTSGDLTSYLNISSSPPNPLSSWLPATQTVDSGATGYFVFQASVANFTPEGNPPPALTQLFNSGPLAQGSLIVAFLQTAPTTYISTAQSGGLFVASAVPEPSTWAMMLLGFVGLAFAFHRKRRVVGYA